MHYVSTRGTTRRPLDFEGDDDGARPGRGALRAGRGAAAVPRARSRRWPGFSYEEIGLSRHAALHRATPSTDADPRRT